MTGGDERADLDCRALGRYFEVHVPDVAGPLRAELLHGGRSNLTYLVTDGVHRWVVRRPPLGLVAPTANDIGREFRVMASLGATTVPVARAISYCDDPSIIGAPFGVASMVEGRVVRSAADGAALEPADAGRVASALVTELATLHAVPYHEVGLATLGRPEGFLARQVDRWHRQWNLVATRSVDALDELHERLARSIPPESAASIVHGDYRIDNTILDTDDPGKVAAIVDWEMATVGDPLTDVGLLLVYWDPICAPVLPDGNPVSANTGFPSALDMARAYELASGRSLEHLDFYRALGYFKLAVIAEGIAGRHAAGLTVGSGFETVGSAVEPLVDAGLELLAPAVRR